MSDEPYLPHRGPDASPTCAGCPCATADGRPSKPVRGFGKRGGFVVVAEGPGTEEVFQRIPLVGPTGKLLNATLKRGQIDPASLYKTNALLCPRPAADLDLIKAVNHCRPRLQQELAEVAPTGVLALGSTAARALELPVIAISEARGTVQLSPFLGDVPVITSLHPASLFKGGAGEVKGGGKNKQNVDAQMMFLQADVEKAHAVATSKIPATWSDDGMVITDTAASAGAVQQIIDEARQWGLLGLDLEWSQDSVITFIGLGHGGRAISVPWMFMSPEAVEIAADAMADETLPKLIHNLQADKGVWELRVGPMRGRILDTLLLHNVSFPGLAHDLQQVSTQFLVIPPWKTAHREERKAHQKVIKDHERAVKHAAQKAEKMKAHEEKNAQKKAEAEARKAQRIAEHEAKNAASAAEATERKGAKRRGRPPVQPPTETLSPRPELVVQAAEVVAHIAEAPPVTQEEAIAAAVDFIMHGPGEGTHAVHVPEEEEENVAASPKPAPIAPSAVASGFAALASVARKVAPIVPPPDANAPVVPRAKRIEKPRKLKVVVVDENGVEHEVDEP